MNGLAAFFTGSVVMLAETLQGIADLVSAGMAYIGLQRSTYAPSKKHPLGFGREIYFWTILSSLVMFVVLSGLSFYFGFLRLSDPEPISYLGITFLILTISIITNGYSFSLSFRRIMSENKEGGWWKHFYESTKTESKTTFILDLVGTLAASVGLLALGLYYFTGDTRFDGLGAMAIGLIMAIFSLILLFNTKDFVVGKTISDEEKNKIRKVVEEFKEVNRIVYLKATSFGFNKVLIHLGVNLSDGLITDEIENLIDRIESKIKEVIPESHHILVELEK